MATQDRKTSAYLKQNLLKNGSEYSFFQVLRLIDTFDEQKTTDLTSSELNRRLRIRPHLSLAFPEADIEQVNEIVGDDSSQYEILANFLGLYGVSSPLPTFYTEELLDEASEDESVTREFLDTLNHRLYLLLFESMQKYRPFYHFQEGQSTPYKERLFCLEGIGENIHQQNIPRAEQLLRYIGLFSQRPRSAEGLQLLLSDSLGYDVEIICCIVRRAKIPEEQLLRLGVSGGMLGEDCILGRELDDRMGRFRIKVGPLTAEEYRGFFPGSSSYTTLVQLAQLYLQDPLEYEVEVFMHEQQAQTVCLGNSKWSRLGIETWLFAGSDIGVTKNTFYPHEQATYEDGL